MHFYQGPLLISFIGESMRRTVRQICSRGSRINAPHKAIPPRNTGQWVQHDLGALAAQEWPNEFRSSVIAEPKHWVAEYGDEIRVRSLWCQITDEDAVLLRILLLLMSDWIDDGGRRRWGSRRRPVEHKGLGGIGHREILTGSGSDLSENRGGVRWGREREVTVSGVVGLLACGGVWSRMGNFDVDGIPAHEATYLFRVLFVHPGFELTPQERRTREIVNGSGLGMIVTYELGVLVRKGAGETG